MPMLLKALLSELKKKRMLSFLSVIDGTIYTSAVGA